MMTAMAMMAMAMMAMAMVTMAMVTMVIMTAMALMAMAMAMIDVKVGWHFVSSSAAVPQFCTKSWRHLWFFFSFCFLMLNCRHLILFCFAFLKRNCSHLILFKFWLFKLRLCFVLLNVFIVSVESWLDSRKIGLTVVNLGKLFLHRCSHKRRKIYHRAVLLPKIMKT